MVLEVLIGPKLKLSKSMTRAERRTPNCKKERGSSLVEDEMHNKKTKNTGKTGTQYLGYPGRVMTHYKPPLPTPKKDPRGEVRVLVVSPTICESAHNRGDSRIVNSNG